MEHSDTFWMVVAVVAILIMVALAHQLFLMERNDKYCTIISKKRASINESLRPHGLELYSICNSRDTSPCDVKWTTVPGSNVGMKSYEMWKALEVIRSGTFEDVFQLHRELVMMHETDLLMKEAAARF